MPGRRIRVVLADDNAGMRWALASLLRKFPDIELVGEASNGQAAVELVRRILPDVAIMDVAMPVMDGVEATRVIHSDLPQVQVIGLSTFDEAEIGERMRQAGAVKYICKIGSLAAVIQAIRTCHIAFENNSQPHAARYDRSTSGMVSWDGSSGSHMLSLNEPAEPILANKPM